MIYTVTLNPSIDFIVRIDKVEIGEVNRMESDDKFAGGKVTCTTLAYDERFL